MITAPKHIVNDVVYRSPETVGTLIKVHRSEGKGYGIFALKDIPVGSIILSEAPLVNLVDDGARVDPLDGLVDGLPPALKKAYQSLHSYRQRGSESLNRTILYSNGFAVGKVATGVFEIASRFNHSCVPNSEFDWHEELGRMVYKNRYPLMEGEEVTIDYGHKKGHLKKFYGFECNCGGCTECGSVTSSSEVCEKEVKRKQEIANIGALALEEKGKESGKENGIEDHGKREQSGKDEGEKESEK